VLEDPSENAEANLDEEQSISLHYLVQEEVIILFLSVLRIRSESSLSGKCGIRIQI
jgi:hypothetical protein